MTENQTLNAQSALACIKEGFVVKMRHASVMAAWRNGKVLISQPGLSLRLEPENFMALYGSYVFELRSSETGIDEAKDIAYYAWREEHQ